jgi:hypothetical protein
MTTRKESNKQRVDAVIETLNKIATQQSLNRDIRNINDLAKKVILICRIKIGYSTLLKKEQVYRELLERTLVAVLPIPLPVRDSGLHGQSSNPENWFMQKVSYESQIGMLKREASDYKAKITQLDLATAQANGRTGKELLLSNAESISSSNKLCHVIARVLDYCSKEGLGLTLDVTKGEITDVYGERVVPPNILEPYLSWQRKNKVDKGDLNE